MKDTPGTDPILRAYSRLGGTVMAFPLREARRAAWKFQIVKLGYEMFAGKVMDGNILAKSDFFSVVLK